MGLTNQQRKQLREALQSAFPDLGDFKIVLDDLGWNLGNIAKNCTTDRQIFHRVVCYADSCDRIEALVREAREANPGNPQLKVFTTRDITAKELAELCDREAEAEENQTLEECKKIEKIVKKKENEFQDLERCQINPDRIELEFKKYIRKLDFKDAIANFKNTIGSCQEDVGYFCFLIEQSYALAGDIYLEEIRYFIEEESMGKFRYYPIELSVDMIPDEWGILNRLAGHFGIENSPNPNINEISRQICHAIHTGVIIFFEFNFWSSIPEQTKIIDWFVNQFWVVLTETIKNTCDREDYCKVKIIAILNLKGELKDDCASLPYICRANEFHKNIKLENKLINIALRKWTQNEIKNWLYSWIHSRSTSEIDRLAQTIYDNSLQGTPNLVRDLLKSKIPR